MTSHMPKTTRRSVSSNHHVLIIDQDQDAVRCLLEILAHHSIHATVASTQDKARTLLSKFTYELVFISSLTKGHAWYEQWQQCFSLLQTIRSQAPEVPVMLMASMTDHTSHQLTECVGRCITSRFR